MYCEKCGSAMSLVENGKNIGTVAGGAVGGGAVLCGQGAAIGSLIMPGLGTAIGGIAGLLAGIVGGAKVGNAVGSVIDNQLQIYECPYCHNKK